jgi:hypothetical protein
MSEQPAYTLEEIEAFAKRYGLVRLKPEHIARMRELASYVSDLGRTLPRVTSKHDAPASFR